MSKSTTFTPNAVLLAQALERLERSGRPDAGQYRLVAQRMAEELARLDDDELLQALLNASPAAAELYENLQYRHAGLCRSALDASLAAERQARQAIEQAMRPRAHQAPPPTGA